MTDGTASKEAEPVDETVVLPGERDWPRPWMGAFLTALSLLPTPSAACRSARISRNTVYTWRNRDEAFAAAWDEALHLARENTERIAHQFATTGLPVRRRKERKKLDAEGRVVEHVIEEWEDAERSATLMIFWLKAWYPDRYRWAERVESTGRDGGPVKVEVTHEEVEAAVDGFSAEVVRLADVRAARDGAARGD